MTATTVSARKIPLGPGRLLGFRDGLPAPAQLTDQHTRIRLSGPLAAVEVRQTFHNPYPEALEFCYLFPWNEGATLSRFRAQVGDRLLETLPADDLPESHRPAALAQFFDGETAPVFSVGLGLLEPDQTLSLELFYAELTEDFHFPLAGCAQGQVQALLEAPVLPYECNLPSRSQHLANGDVLLELKAGPFREDLHIRLQPPDHAVLRQGSQHFVLQAPPTLPGPRDLVVLVDLSENVHFAEAQRVARQWLEQLGEHDQFALVSFHHQIEGFEMGGFHPRTKTESALGWLSQRRPAGRADLAVLLERVLSLPRHRHLEVVLLAGGPVGNEPELYAKVCAAPNPPPFHTVGLGAVNRAFLRRLQAVTQPLRWQDQGLCAQPASVTASRPQLGRKTGNGGLHIEGRAAANFGCHNPALPMIWASQKVAEMLDELRLIQGPRASQLRQISQSLCREYRLLTEISPLAVAGKKLPSLYPQHWLRPAPVARPKPRVLPVLVSEPPKVRAGLVPPQGSTPCPGGLKAKFVRAMKYEAKRKPVKPVLKKADPLVEARRLLKADQTVWKDELRALYRGRSPEQLATLLVRLRCLGEKSSVLAEVYRVGLACYQGLRAGHPKAGERTAQWVEKFAILFK